MITGKILQTGECITILDFKSYGIERSIIAICLKRDKTLIHEYLYNIVEVEA